MTPSPRIVFAGSVNTSRTTLKALIKHQVDLAGVLELVPAAAKNVSGYARLGDLADASGTPCASFAKINEPQVLAAVGEWAPDLLFVVGLSQLVADELLSIPRLGCIGFHPTLLPQGRGRAPIAWLALGQVEGAATFFLMDEGTDSGPILAQERFSVPDEHYAADIEQSVNEAICRALDRWLPELLAGEWNPVPQDEALAGYLGRRSPSDGLIRWDQPAREILRLVRAASQPFPGAYTYAKEAKVIVWRASLAEDLPWHGVVGRILLVEQRGMPIVQTGDGLLRLEEFEITPTDSDVVPSLLRTGIKLGYAVEDEVHRLRRRVTDLEAQVARLAEVLEPSAPIG